MLQMERDVERDAAEWEHLSQVGLRNLEVELILDVGDALPVVDPINHMEDRDWRVEDDDLLGDDLLDDLRHQAPPSINVSPGCEKQSGKSPMKSQIASVVVDESENDASLLLGLNAINEPGKTEKIVPKKKEAHKREAHARRGQKSPFLLINAASRKIQSVKGKSPAKRVASKAGTSKQRGSRDPRKSAAIPPNEVFPSSSSMTIIPSDMSAGLLPPDNIK